MASTALPLDRYEPQASLAATAALPEGRIRALAWPCCAAPSVLHAWDALAQCASEPNPFHESWYQLASLRALDPEETVEMLLFEIDGDLAGIMPLARNKRYYGRPIPHLAAWTHANSFLGAPLIGRGLERRFWRAVLDWADRNAGKALFLHLPGMPLEGRVAQALRDVLEEQGRKAGLVHREERAMLASRQTPEAYFAASLSTKKRKELRRQLARLAEQGRVDFARAAGQDGLAQWTEDFLALEAAGWKGKQGSALACEDRTATMFRQALAGAAAHDRLERLTLTVEGKPIAMLANFATPPGMFSYKTAYDEAWSRFSPGVLLQCENLLVLDRREIAWSDSCAAEGHPMIDHIWRERRAIGRLSIAIGGKLRRAAFHRLLKAELGRNPTGIEK